ncbi:MAG: hypothetical protein K2U26_14550, partial [Cyclobacteriaceae bacterium]|nr:hypothetical protein [Cyclobacteriaceae bacterium]
MKLLKHLSITVLVLLHISGVAQNFSSRTNDVVLDFKQPPVSATSLPVINWTTPRLENTISQNSELEIEALVQSDIPLKNLKLVLGDGSAVRGQKVIEIKNTLSQSVKQSLKLMDGNNSIEIVAENINGGKVSSTRSVLVGKDAVADAIAVDRKDYVLLFATDK